MIVGFGDQAARAAFLDLIERERPDIRRACHISRALPQLIIRIANKGEAANWITARLIDYSGKSYDDEAVQSFAWR